MENRDNTFIIFKNDNQRSDKAPGYTGKGLYKGEEIELALWVKEGKKGKFFSGKINPKRERQQEQQPPAGGRGTDPIPDSDIPF